MANIALPTEIDFMRWASQVRVDLSMYSIPIAESPEKWREWAIRLIQGNSIDNVPLPTELSYPNPEDWRRWAIYFVRIIQQQ
jgi:hypothetical protein